MFESIRTVTLQSVHQWTLFRLFPTKKQCNKVIAFMLFNMITLR